MKLDIHPYSTKAYADSLAHWGKAISVPEWGGYMLARGIKDGGEDTVGTYPIAVFAEDADVQGGLDRLRRLGYVSATLVLDDFHRWPLSTLRRYFGVVRPFKTHYLRRADLDFRYGKHHRHEVGRALKKLNTRVFAPAAHMEEWLALYGNLKARHGLGGIHDFPQGHFEALAKMSGAMAVGAWLKDEMVSGHLWVSDGRRVHSHLAASSEEGYRLGGSYAVYDASLRYFADAELVNLGGGAGARDDAADGLARFKRGFSNAAASAYLCGAVLDRERYETLVGRAGGIEDAMFFPGYRNL